MNYNTFFTKHDGKMAAKHNLDSYYLMSTYEI